MYAIPTELFMKRGWYERSKRLPLLIRPALIRYVEVFEIASELSKFESLNKNRRACLWSFVKVFLFFRQKLCISSEND